MIYVTRYLLIVLYTIWWGSLALPVALFDRSGAGIVWVARRWVRWILRTCGVTVLVDGLENIDPSRGCVYMSNHQSVFDVAAIVDSLPVDWRFVAKRELTWIPFFGWALATSGQVIVDRGDRERSVRSLERAAGRVRDGLNVIIFPEGTRSADARLGEFKSGGFHLAISAGAPVVPISVSGSWRITPKRSMRVESGTVRVRYGKPIPTAGLCVDDRAALKARVREEIQAGLDPAMQPAPVSAHP